MDNLCAMPWPHPNLTGEHVELRPMRVEDAPALMEVTPRDTFQWYLRWPDPWTPEGWRTYIAEHIGSEKTRAYTVFDRASGAVVGSSSFVDIDEKNRACEIGCTWYSAAARGTKVNPECKLLMLRHALEVMNCVRVTLKTDARNLRSQRAMAALGFVREGTLRNHRIRQDGTTRDTVYFSVLPRDWDRVQEIIGARLHPAKGSFTVRAATEADVEATLPLVRMICEQHESADNERFTFRPDIIERYRAWLPERVRDPRSVYFVAEADGAIVGHVVGTVEPEVPIYWTPESAWIHDIVVLPEWRKRGVASALVQATVREFTRIGASRIRLETAAINDAARKMFASCGFRHSTSEMLLMLSSPPRKEGVR